MELGIQNKQARVVFNVPLTSGQYAPEVLYLYEDKTKPPDNTTAAMDFVSSLVAVLESDPPAGAVVEVDLLRVGGNARNAGDWLTAMATANARGVYEPLPFNGWFGVRLRAKSGGTAGTLAVSVAWNT
jgi:hypothetical protein